MNMSIFRRSRIAVVSQSNRNCDIGFSGVTIKTHRCSLCSETVLSWFAAQQTDQRPTMTLHACATPLKLTIIDIFHIYFNFQLMKPFRVIRINICLRTQVRCKFMLKS